MSLEKSVKLDQITITELGTVLYRETTTITENGKTISESVHRTSLTPGQDIAGQPDKVIAICELTWTPEVVATYEAHVEEHRWLTWTPEVVATYEAHVEEQRKLMEQ